jgi:hypothetical protein
LGLDQELHLFDSGRVKIIYEPKSLMPSDYDKKRTRAEFDDLMVYLTRLGNPPVPLSAAVKMPGWPE